MISRWTQLLLSSLLQSVISILCRSTMESLDFRRSPHLQGVFFLLLHFRRKGKNIKMFASSRLANQAHTMETLTGEDFPDILRWTQIACDYCHFLLQQYQFWCVHRLLCPMVPSMYVLVARVQKSEHTHRRADHLWHRESFKFIIIILKHISSYWRITVSDGGGVI